MCILISEVYCDWVDWTEVSISRRASNVFVNGYAECELDVEYRIYIFLIEEERLFFSYAILPELKAYCKGPSDTPSSVSGRAFESLLRAIG